MELFSGYQIQNECHVQNSMYGMYTICSQGDVPNGAKSVEGTLNKAILNGQWHREFFL